MKTGRRAEDPVPFALLTQARAASRNGIGLDTVLRRYSAAYTSFGDHLIEAAEDCEVSSAELKLALQIQAAAYDRFMVVISTEHAREEQETRLRGGGQRRAELVRMLLAGDPIDTAELGYPLDGWHLAVIAAGPEVGSLARELAAGVDRRLLMVAAGERSAWLWFGGQRRLDGVELASRAQQRRSTGLVMALGEPARGIDGWRHSHRQAQAAMPIARRRKQAAVRYVEVALLASMLQDEVLVRTLREFYLAPLTIQRDRGEALLHTLRTYFCTERNASSTAAALGVDRKTVNNRLRIAEEQLGQPLSECAAELEAALQLESFESLQ